MTQPGGSTQVSSILEYARNGKIWPSGRLVDAIDSVNGYLTDQHSQSHIVREETDAAIREDWEPELVPGYVLTADEIKTLLHKSMQIDLNTGLPLYANIKIPIVGAIIRGAFKYESLEFKSPLQFNDCLFEDDVNLKDAQLSLLVMRRCKLPSLSLKRAHVERSVVIEHCIISCGLNLRGVQIGGLLGLKRSRLADGGNQFRALDLRNAKIAENVFLRRGFCCFGLADLGGVTIGGTLDCEQAHFLRNEEGVEKRPIVLRAKNADIKGSVFLTNNLYADGELNFRRAKVGNQFNVRDSTLIQNTPKYGERPFFALNLEFAVIGQDLAILKLKQLVGDIGLQTASAKTYADLPEEWLSKKTNYSGKLWLSGFVYEAITRTRARVSEVDNVKFRSESRLFWLKKVLPRHYFKDRFIRQPWDQVALALERGGDYESANRIKVEAERKSFKRLLNSTLSSPWRSTAFPIAFCYYVFLKLIRFGYGFGYARIFPILFIVLCLNIMVFGVSANAGRMKPLEEEIIIEMNKFNLPAPPEHYVVFNTCTFAADVLLPISLGQDTKWTPMHKSEGTLTINSDKKDVCAESLASVFSEGSIMSQLLAEPIRRYARTWLWLNKLFGWIAFVLIGATFAGKFRPNST